MNRIRTIALAQVTLALLACNQPQQAPQPPNQSAEMVELKEAVKRLEDAIVNLQVEGINLKARQDQYDTAVFDPAKGRAFQKVETTSGYFLVALDGVTPYLDGVKVKLQIGNPQSATYNGFEITANYGRRFPKYDAKKSPEERKKLTDAYQATKRNKSETFTQVLRPGTWNTTFLILPDIKPEDFGNLELSLNTAQVSLIGSR